MLIELKVLDISHIWNIIVYALPANTSGKTQPLDLVVFARFKEEIDGREKHLDCIQFLFLPACCNQESSKVDNIIAGFSRSNLWPIDKTAVLESLELLMIASVHQYWTRNLPLSQLKNADSHGRFCSVLKQ